MKNVFQINIYTLFLPYLLWPKTHFMDAIKKLIRKIFKTIHS